MKGRAGGSRGSGCQSATGDRRPAARDRERRGLERAEVRVAANLSGARRRGTGCGAAARARNGATTSRASSREQAPRGTFGTLKQGERHGTGDGMGEPHRRSLDMRRGRRSSWSSARHVLPWLGDAHRAGRAEQREQGVERELAPADRDRKPGERRATTHRERASIPPNTTPTTRASPLGVPPPATACESAARAVASAPMIQPRARRAALLCISCPSTLPVRCADPGTIASSLLGGQRETPRRRVAT